MLVTSHPVTINSYEMWVITNMLQQNQGSQVTPYDIHSAETGLFIA